MKISSSKEVYLSILAVVLPLCLQLGFIRFASYKIDKHIYGEFVILQSILMIVVLIGGQVPLQAFSRFFNVSRNRTQFDNDFALLIVFLNIFSIVLSVIFLTVWASLDFYTMIILLAYLALQNLFSFHQQRILLRLDRVKYIIYRFSEASSKFLFPLTFYVFSPTINSLVLGLMMGYLLSNAIHYCFEKMLSNPLKANLNHINKYLKFSYTAIFISAFSWGITFSDRFFIEYFGGFSDVAIYVLIAQTSSLGLIVGQIYSVYVTPKVYKLHEIDNKKAYRYVFRMVSYLSVFFVCAYIIILYIIPLDFFHILLSPDTISKSENINSLYILIAGSFFTISQTALSIMFNLRKELPVLSFIYLLGLIVNIAGNLFIMKYGMIAAAISTTISWATIFIFQIIWIYKKC